MDLRKLAKHSSWYLIGSLASRGVGMIMTPIYARYLSPAEYGSVELIELCTQVAVIALGIQAIGGSLLRVYHDYEDSASQKAVASTAFLNTAAIGLLITVMAWFGAGMAGQWLFGTNANTLWIRVAFVAMFVGNLAEVSLLYQRLKDRVAFVVIYSLVQLFASVGLNIYFIVFNHAGVWGFILSKLIVSLIGGGVLVVVLLSQTGIHWRREPSHKLNSFGFPLLLTGLATFVIHFSDRFFLGRMASLQDVGIYSLAYKFGFLITYLVGEPFGRVWGVDVYKSTSSPGWSRNVGRASLYLMFFLFFLGLGISIFAPQIATVVGGNAYAAAAPLIPILVLAYIARELGDVFRTLLYVNKRAYVVTMVTMGCAALNATLNYVLISRYGMIGAAWSTLATWLAYMAWCWMSAGREIRISTGPRAFVKIFCCAMIVFGLSRIGVADNSMLTYARNFLLMGLFCAAVFASGYFPKDERQALTAVITRRLARAT